VGRINSARGLGAMQIGPSISVSGILSLKNVRGRMWQFSD